MPGSSRSSASKPSGSAEADGPAGHARACPIRSEPRSLTRPATVPAGCGQRANFSMAAGVKKLTRLDPAGPAGAARPQARHRAHLARLHHPARRVRRPGELGPALHRRRGAPSPAGLDQVHRRRRPAQRTHPAPVRAGHSCRPVVRHGRGSRGRRGPDVPARPHRGRQDPARLLRATRRARPGPARALGARHGAVPASGNAADPGDGRADPGPASRPASRASRRPRPTRIRRPSAGSASTCGRNGSTGCLRCSPRSTGRSSSSDRTSSATWSPCSPTGSRPRPADADGGDGAVVLVSHGSGHHVITCYTYLRVKAKPSRMERRG